MASRNLGSLTVDLLLELGGFKEGMDRAARESDNVAKKMQSLAREGAKLTESLATPFEKMSASVLRYNELLKSGAINQQTYDRAIASVTAQFNAANPAFQERNKLLAEGARLTDAARTPLEKYQATVSRAKELLREGAISQETFTRTIQGAQNAYKGTSASAQGYAKALQEGRQLTTSLRTPQEALADSLKRYSALLKVGAINQQTYNRAVSQARAQFKSAESGLSGLGSKLLSANRLLLSFGVGFSAITIANSLKQAAAEAIEYGDEINKASVKSGIAAEQFSELAYAAKQSDIEIASLSTGLKKMQVTLSQAGSGSKAANETLAALGLTIAELRDLSPDRQFELLADRIAGMQDPADRTRAAVELFGKAGADLLPLFEQGAAGIRAAREEAQRMGATLTGEQAAALAAADDAIKRLGQSWDGVARTWTSIIALPLAKGLDDITGVLTGQKSVLDAVAPSWTAYWRAVRENGLNASWFDVIREAKELAEEGPPVTQRFSTGTRLAPGGRNRRPFVPGFQEAPATPKAPKVDRSAIDAAREAAAALQAQADAYKDILTAGQAAMDGLRTPVEEQIAQYQEAKFALEQLAEAYPNLADQAAVALERLRLEGFEDIEITAEKIFPKKEQDKLSVFFEEASRNVQGILSDFLFDPFEEGLSGLADSFAQMLQRMAAEAVAAQIAEKIFGTGGVSSGGGWLGQLANLGMSFFGGGRMSGLGDIPITATRLAGGGLVDGSGGGVLRGPGTGTSDSIPAITTAGLPLLLSSGEHITRAAVVREPGARLFLDSFNRHGMQALEGLMGFAHGGFVPAFAGGGSIPSSHFGVIGSDRMRSVSPGAAGTGGGDAEPMQIVQNFSISAPNGTVSRSTEQQIAAAASRGLSRANRRNN